MDNGQNSERFGISLRVEFLIHLIPDIFLHFFSPWGFSLGQVTWKSQKNKVLNNIDGQGIFNRQSRRNWYAVKFFSIFSIKCCYGASISSSVCPIWLLFLNSIVPEWIYYLFKQAESFIWLISLFFMPFKPDRSFWITVKIQNASEFL